MELRVRAVRHESAWFVAGVTGPARGADPVTWMRAKRALDIATGTLEIAAPAPPPQWCWYVVEHSFVVRYDPATMRAERLLRDGSWVEFRDLADITMNGRQLQSETAAMGLAAKLHAKFPELP